MKMKSSKLKKRIRKFWKKSVGRQLTFSGLKKIAVVVLLIGLNWAGVAAIGQTVGYFTDNKNSSGNVFNATTLDFSLTSPVDFSPDVTPTQISKRTINVVKDGALDFGYKVSAVNSSGGLCGALNLNATFNSNPSYSGPIAGFNNFDAGEFDTVGGNWQFTATLIDGDLGLQGQICTFDFVFDGIQIGGAGFSDTETIQNTVRAGYWDPPVVLNEFLPNPSGNECSLTGINGEWVEIYNKTSNQLDLAGWYIQDAANHKIIIQNSNTLSGSTIIGAQGSDSEWLVVFIDDCILNNDADMVTLYDPNSIQVDSYAYGSPDHNVNNTPGGTNNLVGYWPFDGDLLDQGGNGDNGTNYGATFSTGKIKQGLTLGSSKYVEVPDSPSLDITDKITLEAWVYPTAWTPTYENSILTKAGDGDYGVWNLHYKTTSKGFRFELNNGTTRTLFETTPSTALNAWYHVVGVYDGSEMKLYVNGVLKGSLATSGNIATNNSPLRIGKQFWWGSIYSYWSGKIDEVKIYNRALDATEVLEHYNDVNSSGSAVPEDKSYARIPDGVGTWVDPVPTPGRPNKLVKTGEENELKNVVVIEEQVASPSFSETLESAASAVSEFVSGGLGETASGSQEVVTASGSFEIVASPSGGQNEIASPAPIASESVEPPLDSPAGDLTGQALPEPSPEVSTILEPPVDQPADDGSSIQVPAEPAIPVEPVTVEAPTEPAPPADPPAPAPEQAPAPAEAPAPAPEAPAAPAE